MVTTVPNGNDRLRKGKLLPEFITPSCSWTCRRKRIQTCWHVLVYPSPEYCPKNAGRKFDQMLGSFRVALRLLFQISDQFGSRGLETSSKNSFFVSRSPNFSCHKVNSSSYLFWCIWTKTQDHGVGPPWFNYPQGVQDLKRAVRVQHGGFKL